MYIFIFHENATVIEKVIEIIFNAYLLLVDLP